MTEDDIPGAKLPNAPDKCKKTELSFWLKCRGLKVKKAETRADLCNRVKINIHKGNLKIQDPDPNQCHLILKHANCKKCSPQQQQNTEQLNSDISDKGSDLKKLLPKEGWNKLTQNLPPKFSSVNLNNHARSSGKNRNSVEKPIEKGYAFFWDNYVHDVFICKKENAVFVKGKCFRSLRKTEPPHNCALKLSYINGDVISALCSCIAGVSGHCNHIFALLYAIDHAKKLNLQEFPRHKTCTEKPAEWKKSRTDGVISEPVMNCSVFKPRYDSKSSGIHCTLYDARSQSLRNLTSESDNESFAKLKEVNKNLGIFKVLNNVEVVKPTRLGFSVSAGCPLSYQLSITEANFEVVENVQLPESQTVIEPELPPTFPWSTNFAPNVSTDIISEFGLAISDDETVTLEEKTRMQSSNSTWHSARKHRLTSSKFGLILQRQTNNNEKFVHNTLINGKDLSHVPSVKYGIDNEDKAAEQYSIYMKNCGKPVKLYSCGVVINSKYPWAASSPDRIVFDSRTGFGLVEIKCAHSKRNITPFDACSDPSFFCRKNDQGKPELKRSHHYYAQVQGQLGITGSSWCDFVVYTQKGLSIERIYFNKQYWDIMMPKLMDFYIQHVTPVLRNIL